jgi:uncharacterized membrane protein HdeD (DUF308 family)
MTMIKRQKLNAFLSAVIAGTAGALLAQGYEGDSLIFIMMLGGMILASGLFLLLEDALGKNADFGSSDIIIGTCKAAVGLWIMLKRDAAAANLREILAAVILYHCLYLLQQAAETRFWEKKKAKLVLLTAVVSGAAGLLLYFLPSFLDPLLFQQICLFADAAALLVAAFVLLRAKAGAPAEKDKKPAAKAAPVPTEDRTVSAAQPAAAAAVSGAAGATGASVPDAAPASAPAAAPAEETRPAEPETPVIPLPKEEPLSPEDRAAAQDALKGLGRLASRAKKSMKQTAKNTVKEFHAGMREGSAPAPAPRAAAQAAPAQAAPAPAKSAEPLIVETADASPAPAAKADAAAPAQGAEPSAAAAAPAEAADAE